MFYQVSRTLLSILVDLSNAVVSMVSTYPLISKSSRPFINPLVTVPRPPITITIIYSLEFFTSALGDGLSLEFEWQQVSSSLQDSSQYSGHSQ